MVAESFTQHGYDVLSRPVPDPSSPRFQEARRAIQRAYGPRFTGTPQIHVLADPLTGALAVEPDES